MCVGGGQNNTDRWFLFGLIKLDTKVTKKWRFNNNLKGAGIKHDAVYTEHEIFLITYIQFSE